MGDDVILKKIARRILRDELTLLNAENQRLQRLAKSLTPTDQFQESDVFIAGYPKSGNTWMQLLVASLVYRLDPMAATDSLVQDLVPDIHSRSHYKRYAAVTCFKTHSLPQSEYRKVISIIRDGRDVLCSYRSFNNALGETAGFDEMIDGNVELPFGSWKEHVLAWNSNPYGADILRVRYEDLKQDCVGELQRIVDFLGLKRSREELSQIDKATRVEKMQQREAAFGWDNDVWPTDRKFVRRGISGGYQDELTEEQIKRFNAINGDALDQLGYPI